MLVRAARPLVTQRWWQPGASSSVHRAITHQQRTLQKMKEGPKALISLPIYAPGLSMSGPCLRLYCHFTYRGRRIRIIEVCQGSPELSIHLERRKAKVLLPSLRNGAASDYLWFCEPPHVRLRDQKHCVADYRPSVQCTVFRQSLTRRN